MLLNPNDRPMSHVLPLWKGLPVRSISRLIRSTKVVRRIAALASVIVVAGTVGMAVPASASVSPVHAAGHAASSTSPKVHPLYGTNVEVAILNGGGSCATVTGGDVFGAKIWITHPCSGDDKWEEVPGECDNLGQACYRFEDIHNTSLCLGMDVAYDYVTLQRCSAQFSNWYNGGNNTILNSTWAPGGFLTANSNANHASIFGDDWHHFDEQWTCTGGC